VPATNQNSDRVLFLWVENLHMMVVEQISRRMVYLSDGQLEIYL